jgi:uncharacterized protein with HEPN domain
MRDDSLRLADMLQALERLRTFGAGGPSTIVRDSKTADAMAYELLKLGEAARQVTTGVRAAHPEIPWTGLIRQRNQMVPESVRVDEATLGKFVAEDLDPLERAVRRIVAPPADR